METVSMYKCVYCGKVGEKDEIEACERSCGDAESAEDKIRHFVRLARDARSHATSVKHYGELLSEAITGGTGIVSEVKFTRCTVSALVSNSHSAPIGCGTNFSRKSDNGPLGYAGISCDVEIHIDGGYNSKVGSFVDRLRGCGFNTGTGGSRPCGLGWDCNLFAADFPLFGSMIMDALELREKAREDEKKSNTMLNEWGKVLREHTSQHSELNSKQAVIDSAQSNYEEAYKRVVAEFTDCNPRPCRGHLEATNIKVQGLIDALIHG